MRILLFSLSTAAANLKSVSIISAGQENLWQQYGGHWDEQNKNILAGKGFGFCRKAACFVPATVGYVRVFIINYLFLHLLPSLNYLSMQWTLEWLISALRCRWPRPAASYFRVAQSLGLFFFILLYYVCVQLISRRNNYTGRSRWSEENTEVRSPKLLSNHRSATGLLYDSRQVIPFLSPSHFSLALQPISLACKVSWPAVT